MPRQQIINKTNSVTLACHNLTQVNTILYFILVMGILTGIFFFSPEPLNATPIWAPPPLSELIQESLTNNHDLQSLESRYESLQEEIPFAGSLDDPRIGIGLLNLPTDTFSFSQEPMTQKQIFIAQKVPWFGKLSLRSQKQALQAIRQRAFINARRLELSENIASTYYELGFVTESLSVNHKLTNLIDQILKVAEAKYSSGKGLQQDVLQAQVEQSLLLEEKTLLLKKQRVLQNKINELLSRETFSPVLYSEQITLPEIDLPTKELQERSIKENPWLHMKQAEIDQAKIKIDLAHKDYMPYMYFKAAYGQRDDDATGRDRPDFFSASMTLTVPLWKKKRQDSKLAAEEKGFEAAAKSYDNLASSLPHRVDALVTEISDTRKNYLLYRDALILQAEQWAASSLSGYEVGKVAFDAMIHAQIRLLRLELKSRRYLFTIYQKRAELEKTVGGPLSYQNTEIEKNGFSQESL